MTLRSIVRVLGLLREASAQTSAAASSRPANNESTMNKVLVLYYSSHGHIEEMAYAAAEGIRSVGVEAIVKRVKIGRAACRDRVCQYEVLVVGDEYYKHQTVS